MRKRHSKKQYTFHSIMGLIGDIIFYPIILISLLCCFVLYIDKSENKVPSIFGVSIVKISSGSMVEGGFNVRDVVFLKNNPTKDLRAGDIIAFYYYMDISDQDVVENSVLVQTYDRVENTVSEYNLPEPTQEKTSDRKTVEEVSSRNVKVYFHRIVNIFASNDGTLFFQTQGDNANSRPDAYLICEDYIVGQYSYTPVWLRSVFSFITTTTGIFLLVFLPLSILVLFMMFSIIEQISNIYTERKVLKRELQFNSKEALDANIGIDMSLPDKIQFFTSSPPKYKPKVAQFLWGHLKYGKKKDIIKYEKIMFITEIFEENPKHFWMYWINNTKSKNLKIKIEKMWEHWNLQNNMKMF